MPNAREIDDFVYCYCGAYEEIHTSLLSSMVEKIRKQSGGIMGTTFLDVSYKASSSFISFCFALP